MVELTAEATSRKVTVNGVSVHYHEVGTGAPLVLIHGGGPGASGWSNYSKNIGPLSEQYRVLCPDLPGFGQSDMKPPHVSVPGWWAEIISGFLKALDIPKAHFVGNSLGGMVSLKIALENPEQVDRLILMGSGGSIPLFSPFPTDGIRTLRTFYDGEGPSLQRLKGFIRQFVYNPKLITDELIEQRFKAAMDPRIIENPPMRFYKEAPAWEELWRDHRLATLPHKTLLVWGREDKVMPMDMAFPLLRQIPNARLYVIPQCGHWAQWEHADEFNTLAGNFCRA